MNDNARVKVILNGTVVAVPREITFEKLTETAFPDVQNTIYIDWEVDYRDSEDSRQGYELLPGETLTTTRGMIIDVSYTDKS